MNKPILLIEDEANEVFLMRRAMDEAGILNPLQVVTDGQEAMDYLAGLGEYADRARFPLPCLVLLDLTLPLVMGLDVLKWLRQQPELERIIVIVLTLSNSGPDIELAYRLRAESFLVKSAIPERLSAEIERVKEYWLNHATPDCLVVKDAAA
jgi:CheY-like chemotaxis protein